MDEHKLRALRSLPSVSDLLGDEQVAHALRSVAPQLSTRIVREVQATARLAAQRGDVGAANALADQVVRSVAKLLAMVPRRVINGTGVVIQTNLGRAPVSHETSVAMREAAAGYVALETDLSTGERGGRGSTIEHQMRVLTGAERTHVANNNAAAVFLTLAALCAGRDVLVSRGEAVEIGGGFRIPDVLLQSGANLIEVGTTNRTYVSDYARAITDNTAAILKVHASNFVMIGFTHSPTIADLATLCRERGILLLEDAGSGCLLHTEYYGLAHETTLEESLAQGVDVVCASGDKLLGGPQAGLILGRSDPITRIANHPLARAVRSDKTCLAGLAATLRHYVAGTAEEHVPVWWSISRQPDWLQQRCQSWVARLDGRASMVSTESTVGGGSLPGATLPSFGVAIDSGDRPLELSTRLRTGETAVVPRVIDDRVVIDARTVLAGEDDALIDAILAAVPPHLR